jgi:hypothetical protein
MKTTNILLIAAASAGAVALAVKIAQNKGFGEKALGTTQDWISSADQKLQLLENKLRGSESSAA